MAQTVAKMRLCRRCGKVGRFTSLNPWAKICDECVANPVPQFASDRQVKWGRARNLAIAALIERHRSEYDILLAEARDEVLEADGWPGATLREVDDYERRLERARVEGAAMMKQSA